MELIGILIVWINIIACGNYANIAGLEGNFIKELFWNFLILTIISIVFIVGKMS